MLISLRPKGDSFAREARFGRSVNSAEEGAGGGNMVSPAKKKSDRWDGRSKGKN
jgi:hypothetical protein